MQHACKQLTHALQPGVCGVKRSRLAAAAGAHLGTPKHQDTPQKYGGPPGWVHGEDLEGSPDTSELHAGCNAQKCREAKKGMKGYFLGGLL